MRMPPLNDWCVGRGRGLCGCHPSIMGVWGGDVDYGDATPSIMGVWGGDVDYVDATPQ